MVRLCRSRGYVRLILLMTLKEITHSDMDTMQCVVDIAFLEELRDFVIRHRILMRIEHIAIPPD